MMHDYDMEILEMIWAVSQPLTTSPPPCLSPPTVTPTTTWSAPRGKLLCPVASSPDRVLLSLPGSALCWSVVWCVVQPCAAWQLDRSLVLDPAVMVLDPRSWTMFRSVGFTSDPRTRKSLVICMLVTFCALMEATGFCFLPKSPAKLN